MGRRKQCLGLKDELVGFIKFKDLNHLKKVIYCAEMEYLDKYNRYIAFEDIHLKDGVVKSMELDYYILEVLGIKKEDQRKAKVSYEDFDFEDVKRPIREVQDVVKQEIKNLEKFNNKIYLATKRKKQW